MIDTRIIIGMKFFLIGYRRSDGWVVGSNEIPNSTNINWFLSINKKMFRFYHNIFDILFFF